MNPRFTRLNHRVLAISAKGRWVLSFLICLALPQGMLAATTAETTLPPATIIPSSGPTSCLGLEITFDLAGFDNDQSTITDVPWLVSHNGIELSEAELDDFVQLGTLGNNLSDWSNSSTLAFTPLVEGCFTVGVEPYLIYAVNASQNVQPITVIVADAPSPPVLSGFGAGPGEVPSGVLFCDGGSTNGGVASFTVGEVPMSLSYTFENDLGTVLASDAVIGTEGEACDGPSITMSVNSGSLGVGHYTFTATADNECGATTTSLDVEVVSFPSFTLSSDPICSGENVVVFGDLDFSLFAMSEGSLPTATAVWSNGGTDLISNTYINPTDGELFSQEVTLTYALYGQEASCSSTAEINQVVHTPDSIDLVVSGGIDDNLVCEGSNLTVFLDNVSNTDPSETFAWTTNVPPSASSPLSLSWESFELDVTGTITQTSVWADGTSCENTLDFAVNVSPKPEMIWTTSNATICAESDAGLIVENIASQAIDVTWELPNGATGTVEDIPTNNLTLEGILLLPGVNFPSAGQYMVEATPTGAFGCVGDPIEGLVEVENLPIANATFAEACEGSTVVPTGVVVGAQYDYDWSSTGSASVDQGASAAAPDIVNVSCGDVVSLIVTETFLIDGEELECESEEQTIFLEVVALPEPGVTTASAMCKGVDLVLDLTENNEGTGCTNQSTDYVWTLNNGSSVTTTNNAISVTLPAASFESLDVTIEAEATGTSGLTCATTTSFVFDLFDNPEVNIISTDAICVGSTETLTAEPVSGTGQGGLTYNWSNENDPAAFVIDAPNDAVTDIQVDVGGVIPDEGSLMVTVTDQEGCVGVSPVSTITIIELPALGDLTVIPEAACSGSIIDVALSSISVDDGLNVDDVQYAWSAELNGVALTLNGTGLNVSATPSLAEVPFQDFVGPELLSLGLTTSIAGCSTTAAWEHVAEVYPNPLAEEDNPYVCIGQNWESTITGCEVLTVYGQNGLPDLTWSTADPATGIDISLSPDYFEAPAGQTQNTFVFYRGVTYDEAGLTCFTEAPFQMLRRNAPSFSIVGDDNSGPASDYIMCEGGDLILDTDVTFGGGIAYEWAQFVDDGSGNLTLQTLPSTDEDIIFVDVEASAPLDEPTLIEGIASVTYTYAAPTPADFQCVVDEPWSFQVLPTPVISWSTAATHVCDENNVELSVSLDAGATTLNGTGVTWDWDWNGSTIDQINTTSSPFDVVTVEAQYESTLDGTFDQNFNVAVTDSYGCLSSPPTVVSIAALERAVVGLERPYACSYDTLQVLAKGGDVYTWSVDTATVDGYVEDAVYFPSYAATGDSIQSLVLFNPTHGDVIEVTGGLVYEVSETETVTCESTEDILLVIFDEPELDMSFSGDPAPFCDGDVLTFQDLNVDMPQNVTYDYWTSAGLDIMNEVNNTVSFPLQSEETTFEVTKYRAYFIQADTLYCSTSGTEGFDVIANPVIAVDGDAGMCQDGLGSVVCEVSDPDSTFFYTPTWTASANANTSLVNLGATSFGLAVASANGVTTTSEPNFVFSVYVKDDNGCTSETVSHEMQVVATPILDITDGLMDDQCSPSEDCMQVALLNEDLTGVDVLYFWDNEAGSNNDGICVNFVNPTECPFADSTKVTVRYEHMLVNAETLFCESSAVDSTMVNPTPLPNFSLQAPQSCLGLENLNCVPVLHDTAAYSVCEGDSLSYEWFVTPLGDLIQNNLVTDDLTTPFPSICVDTAGVLNVVLEITNSYGCAQTTSNVPFTVRGLPVPELTFEQPSICLPTTVSILNTSSGAADFSMSIPGYPTYENFLSPLELDVEFPGYYNAEFTVSNTHIIDGHELTCSVDTEYVNAFEGRTPPVAEFAVLPDTLIEFVNPVVEFVNLSEGQIENIWSFGNGEGSGELDPEVEYEAAGFYNAQLQVVNEYGCTDVHSQQIEVYTDLYIYVPTAFTPDNDGLNDAWLPSIIGQDVIATYECSVFTRSGDRVFYTTDPNKAWIGGNDLSGEGVHYSSGGEVFAWRILIKKKDGQGAKTYTGQVTMIR